jgi:hypothetical protein
VALQRFFGLLLLAGGQWLGTVAEWGVQEQGAIATDQLTEHNNILIKLIFVCINPGSNPSQKSLLVSCSIVVLLFLYK